MRTWTFIKPSQCELVFFFTFQLVGEVSGEVESRVSPVLPCTVRCCPLKRCDGGKGPVQARWCSRARLPARVGAMEHTTIDALVAGLRASRERFRLTTEQDLRQLQVELAGLGSTAKVVPTPFVETPTRPRTAGGVGISPRTVEPLRERLRELKARMNAEDAGSAQLMATLRDEPREALACRVVVAERRSDELRAELEVVGHALTRETQRCTAVEQRLRQETANPNPTLTLTLTLTLELALTLTLAPQAGGRQARRGGGDHRDPRERAGCRRLAAARRRARDARRGGTVRG